MTLLKPRNLVTGLIDIRRLRALGVEYKEDQGVVSVAGTMGYLPSQLWVVEVDEPEED